MADDHDRAGGQPRRRGATLRALYTGPHEVIVGAKIHPAPGLTTAELTHAMDGLDATIRLALPEVADVFIDVTDYRLQTLPADE